jgi:hypothetical protein
MSTRNLLFMLAGVVALLAIALATRPALADLPPRPTHQPPPTEVPQPKLIGGWIELRVQLTPGVNAQNLEMVVQWQDGLGAWHNVDSWRGAFDSVTDSVGRKVWWVDQYTFGPTPYRWVVYESGSNKMLAESKPFNLPRENRQTVTVEVSLAP